MPMQGYSERDIIEEWTLYNTVHLDLIASWEELCYIYEILKFKDPIDDKRRADEFKWIIGQTNTFLTKVKKVLLGDDKRNKGIFSIDDAIEYLKTQVNSEATDSRESIAYNRQKQQWVIQAIHYFTGIHNEIYPQEGEDDNEQ